jgi:hypothetical protein
LDVRVDLMVRFHFLSIASASLLQSYIHVLIAFLYPKKRYTSFKLLEIHATFKISMYDKGEGE